MPADLPLVPVEGDTLVINGAGYSTENSSESDDSPPPGAGFVTVTGRVPTLAVDEIWILTVSAVLDPRTSVTSMPSPNETAVAEPIIPIPARETLTS